MKYRVSHMPNSGTAINFKIQDQPGEKQTNFSFSHTIVDVWGMPKEPLLKELMVAYVKRNNWPKETVVMTPKNSPRSLSCYIRDLNTATKSKAKK